MEDGHPLNLALWLDPSVHYFDAARSRRERRGSPRHRHHARAQQQLRRHQRCATCRRSDRRDGDQLGDGLDRNARRLLRGRATARAATSTTRTAGTCTPARSSTTSASCSPTRAPTSQGAWDTERLRFNDFYGAIGWKGVDQDLTVSVTHARQRDMYDESNFEATRTAIRRGRGGLLRGRGTARRALRPAPCSTTTTARSGAARSCTTTTSTTTRR